MPDPILTRDQAKALTDRALSFATADEDRIREGVARLAQALTA